jgi:hypothetical protein
MPSPSESAYTDRPESLIFELDGRPEYAPTPLMPWNMRGPGDRSYSALSHEKYQDLVDAQRANYPEWLAETVHTSLVTLHINRCAQNADAYARIRDEPVPADARDILNRAKIGTATALELLELRDKMVGLLAIGLAKQSHPFAWKATSKMETTIAKAVDTYDPSATWYGNGKGAIPRYAFYRVDDGGHEVHGLVFAEKRNIALVRKESVVVRRRSFVLRLDDELPEEARAPHALQKLGRFVTGHHIANEEKDTISSSLAQSSNAIQAGIEDKAPWLAPIATSYYVRPTKNPKPLDQRTTSEMAPYAHYYSPTI